MKLVARLSIVAAALVLTGPAFAQLSASKNVSVNATLTSACMFDSATALSLSDTYPAFSTSAVTPNADVTIQCTRGGGTPSISFAGGDIGVVGGLVFQLSAAFTATDGGTAPAGSVITDIGSARTGKFNVMATFPANQAGTTGPTTAVTKAMTITF